MRDESTGVTDPREKREEEVEGVGVRSHKEIERILQRGRGE